MWPMFLLAGPPIPGRAVIYTSSSLRADDDAHEKMESHGRHPQPVPARKSGFTLALRLWRRCSIRLL